MLFLAAFVQLISSKVMTPYTKIEEKLAKKTPGVEDDMQVAMQKSMAYTFPLITLLVGMRFPSGLALYWFVFSLLQTHQQVRNQGWGGLTPWIEKIR
jgi:membrane protein insertase Oxa1/YidC/SpoIIIJ